MQNVSSPANLLRREIPLWAGLIKFSHTVFALPFALSMFVVAARGKNPPLSQFLWILLALVSARTAAMAFNRWLDRDLDSLNPRTAGRELPSGRISSNSVYRLLFIAALLFHLSAWAIGVHCLVLAPLVLGFLMFYSWTKRFTSYSHLVLGIALALAPGGVWYAINAAFALEPILMMIAVMFWVGDFDIIYSCQDFDFDSSHGLFSLPARLGIARALAMAKLFHVVSVLFLIFYGLMAALGIYYFVGLAIFALILASQHFIVRAEDLSKVSAAFFTRNGLAAFVYFLSVLADVLL